MKEKEEGKNEVGFEEEKGKKERKERKRWALESGFRFWVLGFVLGFGSGFWRKPLIQSVKMGCQHLALGGDREDMFSGQLM